MPPGEEQLVADARNAQLRRLQESRRWKTMLLFVLAPAAFVLVLFAIKSFAFHISITDSTVDLKVTKCEDFNVYGQELAEATMQSVVTSAGLRMRQDCVKPRRDGSGRAGTLRIYVWSDLVPLLSEAGFTAGRGRSTYSKQTAFPGDTENTDRTGSGHDSSSSSSSTNGDMDNNSSSSSSSSSDVECTAEFYVAQIVELLQALKVWGRIGRGSGSAPGTGTGGCREFSLGFTLVGASLGGAVAAAFAARYPQKVSRLVLLAPAGLMDPSKLPLAVSTARRLEPTCLTCLEVLCLGCLTAYVRLQYEGSQWEEAIDADASREGFVSAFLSILKHFPFAEMGDRFRALGKDASRPVLVCWGDRDGVVPFAEGHLRVMEAIPHASLCVFEGHGHEITTNDGGSSCTARIAEEILRLHDM